jgi:hypothetical protein
MLRLTSQSAFFLEKQEILADPFALRLTSEMAVENSNEYVRLAALGLSFSEETLQ